MVESSKRADIIKPFIVMEVMERSAVLEAEGRKIIHMEVGEPDFDTPRVIIEAAYSAMIEGKTHYTHSLGLPQLREAISRHYKERYSVDVTADQVVVTMGSSPAFLVVLAAIINPGDEVVLPDPHYSCYPNYIEFLGGRPVYVKVYEEDGFQYRPEDIKKKISSRTKAIMINSPANPTGNLLSAERMKEIAGLGPFILSDEIYHQLVYEGSEHTILEFTDNAAVINGFSKAYAMTGWRLGYVIMPRKLVRPVQKMLQNFFISPNAFVQWAGVAALEKADAEVRKMRDIFDERRKFVIRRLREIGFGIRVEPTGAFYVFANAKKWAANSFKFAFDILEKAGVGVTPGIDFGENGEGYLRFSYANSMENLKEGMDRLEEFIKACCKT